MRNEGTNPSGICLIKGEANYQPCGLPHNDVEFYGMWVSIVLGGGWEKGFVVQIGQNSGQ